MSSFIALINMGDGRYRVFFLILLLCAVPSCASTLCTSCAQGDFSGNAAPVRITLLDLEDQYVEVTNTGPDVVSLYTWTLTSHDSTLRFVFPHFLLGGGSSVRVCAGNGIDTNTVLFTHNLFDAWDREGDTATLCDSQGNLVAERHQGPGPVSRDTPLPTTVPAVTPTPARKTPVQAEFGASPRSGPAPFETAFSDLSTGSPVFRRWSFGDGSISEEKDPVHTYPEAGTYTVQLMVTGPGGSSTLEKAGYIVVYDPSAQPPRHLTPDPTPLPTPVPTVTPTPSRTETSGPLTAGFSSPVRTGEFPLDVQFLDESGGDPDRWSWSFGDGSVSDEKNPLHTYYTGGTYEVGLTVFQGGTTSSVRKPGWISSGPIPTTVPATRAPATPVRTETPPATVPVTTPSPVRTQPAPAENSPLKVHFIDVGQGDSILLQSGGKNLLVDAGQTQAGDEVVWYLSTHGVGYLDTVVATHPHEDHVGGLVGVLSRFPVGSYLDSGEFSSLSSYEQVRERLTSDQVPCRVVKAGDRIPFADGVAVEVMNPATLTGDPNDDSVVLKVTKGDVRVLLTGDCEKEGQSAQLLKVPHHGSAMSFRYFSLAKPRVAVISVGAVNSYGHPAQGTLDALSYVGSAVYRTDRDGSVVVTTDGSSWTVRCSSSPVPTPKVTQAPFPPPLPETPRPSPPTAAPTFRPTTTQPSPVPTTLPVPPCDCSGPDLDCGDFAPGMAQVCYESCLSKGYGDVFRLDGNKNGIACE